MALSKQTQDVQDVTLQNLTEPVLNASVNGILLSLSSMRSARSTQYFTGTITDGYCKLRLVGFQKGQLRKLTAFTDHKKSINLRNCYVKKSKYGEKMEIILKANTDIIESAKKFDTSTVDANNNDGTTLAQIEQMESFDRVNAQCKVTLVKDVVEVSSGKKKQEVIVGDSSGIGVVTLWESYIGALQQDRSYSLKNFAVREFANRKYLSIMKEESEIVPIEDIGEVSVDTNNDEARSGGTLTNVQIIAIPQLDSYKCCLGCKARVEPCKPPLGQCSRCAMMQRYDACAEQVSAKLMIKSDTETLSLFAFGNKLKDLAQLSANDLVTTEAFLSTQLLQDIKFNSDRIITSFTRE